MKKQDIELMVNLIDICASRGGFKGNELATVGGLRERLVTLLREEQIEKGSEA